MRFFSRLRLAIFRNRLDSDTRAEIESHLDLLVDHHIRTGMSADEARVAARKQFGNVTFLREDIHRASGFRAFDDILQDFRYAVRSFRRTPAIALSALLTIAIGIGSTTAIVTIVDSMLVRPLRYPGSDRIVEVIGYRTEGATRIRSASMARPHILGISERSRSFSAVGSFDSLSNITRRRLSLTVAGQLGTGELFGSRISPQLLSMLHAKASTGRLFVEGDETPGQNNLIVLSDRSWRVHFGANASLLGTALTLDTRPYTLIGVMEPEFDFPDAQTDFWIPLTSAPNPPPSAPRADSPDSYYADGVFARLADGVSIGAASAEVDSILRHVDLERAAATRLSLEQMGRPRNAKRAELVSMKDELVAPARPMLLALSLATALLLLIACANLVSLFMERRESRSHEMAIRAALGGTRQRAIRLFVVEGIALALLGGMLGVAFALWTVQLATLVAPADIPRLNDTSARAPVVVIMMAVSAAIGGLVGIVAAWRTSRTSQLAALARAETTTTPFSGFPWITPRTLIVVAQVSMAVLLCVGAGLLVRSFIRLVNVSPGYDVRHVMSFQIVPPAGRTSEQERIVSEVVEQLGRNSAMMAVAATDVLPVAGAGAFHLSVGGLPVPPGPDDQMTMRIVTRQYFQAIGMTVLRGRTFSDGTSIRPEIIVNQEFVRRYFGTTEPLGHVVGDSATRYEVIGIVNDVRQGGLTGRSQPEYYVNLRGFGLTDAIRPHILVRSDANQTVLAGLIRATVHAVDPAAGTDLNQHSMSELASASIERPRFNTLLLGTFAFLALMLAAVGLYGLMAHAVTRRTREIGIRMAIGATTGRVLVLVLSQSLWLTSTGAGLGLLMAGAVTRYLQGMLFELTPLDPLTFVAVAVLFVSIALLASCLPALRASNVDPLVALREN